MKTDSVIVKRSKINGKGVFAARNFKKNEPVLHWDLSKVLSKSAVSKLPAQTKKYVTYLNGKFVMMPSPEKYVNHSCEPNTTAKNFCDVAIRSIKKGEEITANYEEELLPGTFMRCHCGSKKCRKIIKG